MGRDIRSLAGVSFDSIYRSFQEAFKDYEMQLDGDGLKSMLNRRGFKPELSFAAFEDERILAFTFNGIGIYNGLKTAYDTGTGTIEEFRGQGLATEIFQFSIPFLKEAGVSQYLLEVLQHNDKAVSVYRKIGFSTSREFNYFVHEMKNIQLIPKELPHQYVIKKIDVPNESEVKGFWDFSPSWQNNHQAIERAEDDFITFGALKDQELVGYCIFEPLSGDITQIAVHKKHRRQGIGSRLLKTALSLNEHDEVKAINTSVESKSTTAFLETNLISLSGQQFEMIKKL